MIYMFYQVKRSKVALLIFAFSTVLFSTAQDGPGGVGNAASNGLWLRTDMVNQANNTVVSNWPDASGNGNDANQITSGIQPLFFTSSSLNSQPTIRFDGSDDEMAVADAAILDGTSGITYYVVLRPNNLNGSPRGILGKRVTFTVSTEYAYTWFFHGSNRLNLDVHTQNNRFNTGATTFSNANNYILSWDYDGTLASSVRSRIRNGSSVSVVSSESSASIPNSNQAVAIGALNVGYGTYLGADYTEIIQYNYALDSLDHILIQNYLSAKYNIAITSNNLYVQDNALNGNYDFDVAGIGRIGASINDNAIGSGVLRMLNPTNLDDNEFLIWGHDGGVLEAIEMADIPASMQGRLDRVWRVNEVNGSGVSVDVGSLDIRFDLNNLGPITATDLRLLIDTDNDGFFNDETPISGATSLGSNIFEFSAVNGLANDLRMTMGTINLSQTPLPVKLISFKAFSNDNKTVELHWQTATEINNDFFTIEKSNDGSNWLKLLDQSGAGNSFDILNYFATDDHPFDAKSYYRLKQTDLNGDFTYAQTQSVFLRKYASAMPIIFPNPTKNSITILYQDLNLNSIDLYNSLGQNVTNSIIIIDFQQDKTELDLSNLSQGIYFISINNVKSKIFKQ